METVALGRSGLRIPRIGLGTAPLGREIDEETSRDLLDYAVSRGLTLLDTAESYGGGNAQTYRRETYGIDDVREATGEMHSSEMIIGRWLRDRRCRDRVQLCTKFSTGGTAERIQAALVASLKRLQTDHVDIYMPHKPYPDVPVAETLAALDAHVRLGRVRSIGCSNFKLEQLREVQTAAAAGGLARVESTQPPFSLADPSARRSLLPYCVENDIAVVAYSPLAAGFLAGKYSRSPDGIPKGTRFDIIPGHIDVYFSERNFQLVERLRALSVETGEPMVKLAMAWVFSFPAVSCILVGARRRSHIDNALEAMALPLDAAIKTRMDAWVENDAIHHPA
jgi:1-deoxyxylulose-5-phosphate synthase